MSFLILLVILFLIGFYGLLKSRKEVRSLRNWFIAKLDIPEISNIQIISKDIFENSQPVLILKKIFLDNTQYFDLGIIDFFNFDYKNKSLALLNFWWGQSNSDDNKKYYSYLIFKNSHKIQAKTLAWSHRKFGIKLRGQNLENSLTLYLKEIEKQKNSF